MPSGPELNPYSAPRSDAHAANPAASPLGDLTKEEAIVFVGRQAAYYWESWQRQARTGRPYARFNWAACFFNVGWMLYRKMLLEALIAVAVMAALGFGLGALGTYAGVRIPGAIQGLEAGITVGCGLLGNNLYLLRTRREVERARRREADPKKRVYLLAARGGTSWVWPALAFLLSVVLGSIAGRE